MIKISQSLLLSLALVLGACGGDTHVAPVNYTPELYSYDLLDSYDTDTAYSNAPLAINPYLYHGLFEIYWAANSLEDYRVKFLVNDRADLDQAVLIHSERCGAGLWCDQGGSLVCEYGADLTMSCDTGPDTNDISYLFDHIPEQLYLILAVCDIDSPYCEYDYYSVTME